MKIRRFKLIFLLVLVLFYSRLWAKECRQSIDTDRVVLFLNVNHSINELSHAKAAACDAGKRFVAIPDFSIPDLRRFKTINSQVDKNNSNIQAVRLALSGAPSEAEKAAFRDEIRIYEDLLDLHRNELDQSEVQFINENIKEIEAKMSRTPLSEGQRAAKEAELIDLLERGKELDQKKSEAMSSFPESLTNANLAEEIKKVTTGDASIDTLIASGHDGGGSITGLSGAISKYDVVAALDEVYRDNPDKKNDLLHLMLWGCYTTTKNEVSDWKAAFQNLQTISGFLGSGPSDEKLASYTILADMIQKADAIGNLETNAQAKRAVRGITNLNYTLPGIYIDTGLDQCDPAGYYYSIEQKGSRFVTEEGSFTPSDDTCLGDSAELAGQYEDFRKYFEGFLPIPDNTSSGPLRQIYNGFRSNEHCLIQANISYSADQVGLLLFYDGVVDNFMHTFRDEIEEFANLRDTLISGLDSLYNQEIIQAQSLLSKAEKDFRDYQKPEDEKPDLSEAVFENHFNSFYDVDIDDIEKFGDKLGLSPRDILKWKAQFYEKKIELLNLAKEESASVKFDEDFISFDPRDSNSYRDRQKLNNFLSASQGAQSLIAQRLGHIRLDSNLDAINKAFSFTANIDIHLRQLECMDFLEWHERIEGHTALSQCYSSAGTSSVSN